MPPTGGFFPDYALHVVNPDCAHAGMVAPALVYDVEFVGGGQHWPSGSRIYGTQTQGGLQARCPIKEIYAHL